MRFDVVTIFPEYFAGPLDAALIGKARAAGVLDIGVHRSEERRVGKECRL